MNRAYSILNVKSVEEDLRRIRGTATTPAPDRVGDIVEPLGVSFKNPLPLLWQHNHRAPVGLVNFSTPTKEGIEFEATLPIIGESGALKDRIDEAWQSVKAGLVRAVSIGFRSIEDSFMKESGGTRFLKSEVLELSLVTIPANQEATISQVKQIDQAVLAVSGREPADPVKPPGVPGPEPRTKARPKEAKKMSKTILEQITDWENKRAALQARSTEIMTKAAEEMVTLTDDESEEYDRTEAELKKVDEHLARLRSLEANMKMKATPVEASTPQKASESRNGTSVISVKANVPPGTAMTRYAIAKLRGALLRRDPLDIFKQEESWHNTPEVGIALSGDVEGLQKAAVAVGTTTGATWAAPLVAFQVLSSEFVELLRPATIIGRIPGLRRVPFNIQMPRETTGTSVGWVGENAPKPVSAAAFDTITMRWAKAAGIVVLTQELVRFSNPSAEATIRSDLIATMAQFLDRQFVDPAVAAVPNVSPASITNGVSAVAATGTTAAAFRTDVRNMMNTMMLNNLSLGSGVWIMTQQQALSLSMMMSSLSVPLYPGISATGGTLLGYPVVASENIPAIGNSPANGYPLIFALAGEIFLADDGQTIIDASQEASVQMESTPDSPPTASTTLVSLWQMNMLGLRAERWINWLKRRSTAVGYISNAKYAE